MSVIGVLAEKPWENTGLTSNETESVLNEPLQAIAVSHRSHSTALNFFIAIVSVLFSLFLVTFLARTQYQDFEALSSEVWQPFYDKSPLWINTLWLALASVLLHVSWLLLKRQRAIFAVGTLLVAIAFSGLFIVSQMTLWLSLHAQGYGAASNPANAYFYVLSIVHALHVIGGIGVLIFMSLRCYSIGVVTALTHSLPLCARYWHFLFALWLVLFLILTASPATYDTLAAMCGY